MGCSSGFGFLLLPLFLQLPGGLQFLEISRRGSQRYQLCMRLGVGRAPFTNEGFLVFQPRFRLIAVYGDIIACLSCSVGSSRAYDEGLVGQIHKIEDALAPTILDFCRIGVGSIQAGKRGR